MLVGVLPDGPLKSRLIRLFFVATRRRWDRDRIIAAMRGWAEQYGEPPRSREWSLHKLQAARDSEGIERYVSGGWPSASTVEDYFGSWNAAIKAAGFGPRPRGRAT
jgi:hypothetical protein